MLIEYVPPKNLATPRKNYSKEIKNTLEALEDLRR